jgi:hypothetical protein
MLLEVIFLSVFAGLLAGGRISRLTRLDLAAGELIVLAFVGQAFVPRVSSVNQDWGFFLLAGAYLLLMLALSRNDPTLPIGLAALGVALNFLVIAFNRGMPVNPQVLSGPGDGLHVAIDATTRLAWLGDVILWPLPPPLRAFVSLGDIFLTAGVALLIFQGMMYVGGRRAEPQSAKISP